MEDKKNQSLQLFTDGYEPKTELPKDYKLPDSLRKAFFEQNDNDRQMSRDADNINIEQSQKIADNG